jgi:hypothetical protein
MNQKTANLLIVIAIIGGAAIYSSLYPGKSYEEEVEELNIKSVVCKKFTDTENHGTLYLVYKNDSVAISQLWDQYISIGDSIIKPKGYQIMIVKNINKYIEFDFQNSGQLPPP